MSATSASSPESRPGAIAERASAQFWYSPRTALGMLAALFLLVTSVSALIPPFQSPDEFYHLQRAYLLSKGEVILGKQDGITGGKFDTGLLAYMRVFQDVRWFAHDDPKLQAERSPHICLGTTITWTDEMRFERVPNVAVYFPLPYAPQALAFFAGQHLRLGIGQTYYLARFLLLVTTLALLWWALRVYPVPPFVAALFLTPMTFIQLGSATLDGISYAMCVLAAALFIRGRNKALLFTGLMHLSLVVCAFCLATSRPNLIVAALLPAALYPVRHSRTYLISAVAAFALACVWIGVVQTTVSSGNGHDPATSREIMRFYLAQPSQLATVIAATITNPHLLASYWYMFIGMVGWAGISVQPGTDTVTWYGSFLDRSVYLAWGLLLSALTLTSLLGNVRTALLRGGAYLVVAAMAALFLLFPMMLAAWSQHPAPHVDGIQGRYFTPLLILLGFALFSGNLPTRAGRACTLLLFLMTTVTVAGLPGQLLETYWITEPGAASPLPTVAGCEGRVIDVWFKWQAKER